MSLPPSEKDPGLLRLIEISAEFSGATQVIEIAVELRRKELRLSFDNGYSFVIGRDGSATIEPF